MTIVFRQERDDWRPRTARVERHDGFAVLHAPDGQAVYFDRFHVELLALAFGCKVIDAGTPKPTTEAFGIGLELGKAIERARRGGA